MNNLKHQKKLQGFTLIEVLVALAVVAIGLTAVLNATLHASSHANLVQEKIFALWVLENQVAEIRLNSEQLPSGRNQGQEKQANHAWTWETQTESTPNPKIKKIKLSVLPSNTQEKEQVLLQQNLYFRVQP